MKKKGQFLLISIGILIIAMYSIFQYIYTSSETSNILFQPSFSEEAFNLFRAMNNRNEWIEEDWYNFTDFPARRIIINPTSETSLFNISVNCSQVVVINSSKAKVTTTKTPYGLTNCTVRVTNATDGDYIYYFFYDGVEFNGHTNITRIGNESSPWFYYAGERRSKLCSHVREIYSEKQISVECTIY